MVLCALAVSFQVPARSWEQPDPATLYLTGNKLYLRDGARAHREVYEQGRLV